MRVEKKSRWKGVLAFLAGLILVLCTYLTLAPGSLFLPGMSIGVYAVDTGGIGLHTGSAVVVSLGDGLYAGAMAVWQDEGWRAGRVADVGQEQITMTDGTAVAAADVAGRAVYEIYALGAGINALSGMPGRYIVWAADAVYVMLWCIWGLTLPGRRRRRRRAGLVHLFEQYGAQFDLEEEGVEY